MTETLEFEIPGTPISANHAYLNVTPQMRQRMEKNGARVPGRLLTSEGRAYKERVKSIVRGVGMGFAVHTGDELAVEIWCVWPDGRMRDASNAEKLIHDAISEALGVNDRIVHAHSHPAGIDRQAPRVRVVIQRIPRGSASHSGGKGHVPKVPVALQQLGFAFAPDGITLQRVTPPRSSTPPRGARR